MANNRVCHFEIPGDNPEALTKFYGAVFGWRFHKSPVASVEYWICQTGMNGPGIDGAIMQRQHPQHPLTNYIDVANIDATADAAARLGAQVVMPKTAVGDMGWIALLIDPQGNCFGLWQGAAAP